MLSTVDSASSCRPTCTHRVVLLLLVRLGMTCLQDTTASADECYCLGAYDTGVLGSPPDCTAVSSESNAAPAPGKLGCLHVELCNWFGTGLRRQSTHTASGTCGALSAKVRMMRTTGVYIANAPSIAQTPSSRTTGRGMSAVGPQVTTGGSPQLF